MATLNEFCTISDLRFLPQILVLHQSLVENCADFRLRVFCLDDASCHALLALRLPGCVPVGFSRLRRDDPALAAVEPERTRAEFCWTATPAICLNVLHHEPELEMITYLDSDLMFFGDPACVLRELGEDSVLLFPQRCSSREERWLSRTDGPERLADARGEFNAGSVVFRNDDRGRAALCWWRERCLEWCFDRVEPGRWADQRYLSELPRLFPGVRTADHGGAALAPWNSHAAELTSRGGRLLANGVPAVFHHYQSLQVQRTHILGLGSTGLRNIASLPLVDAHLVARYGARYSLSRVEHRLLWRPYLDRLDGAVAVVAKLVPGYVSAVPSLTPRDIMADAAQSGFLTAYHMAGRVLPLWLRHLLSRARRALELRRDPIRG